MIERFVDAQKKTYSIALEEIRRGRKTSHWIWYIFPQIAGLGHSSMSRLYAIQSGGEARAYLKDDVLGPRLKEITRAVLECPNSINEIFGYPDNLKFISSMTLFAHYDGVDSIFRDVLKAKNGGKEDKLTLELLESAAYI